MTFEDLEKEFKEFLLSEYDTTTHDISDVEGALIKQILFLSNKIVELTNKIEVRTYISPDLLSEIENFGKEQVE